jgi:hypothetical protein
MRILFWMSTAWLLLLSPVLSAPTVEEQATYDAACLEVIDAVNAYRAANSQPALTHLVELCQAARELAEFEELGVGVSTDLIQRTRNAGYAGDFLNGTSAFMSRGQVSAATLFQNLLSTPGYAAVFLNSEADYLGVGMAVEMRGSTTEFRLRIILGKEFPGGDPDGTTGQETATGRGLLPLTRLREILAGAWSGDSIDGFVLDPTVVVLTTSEEKAFLEALAAFAKKSGSIRVSAGGKVNLKLPPQLAMLLDRAVLKGRIPPGVRFDARTNSFKGAARSAGTYTVTLSGDLKGPVKGSEKLKPIRIRFTVQG